MRDLDTEDLQKELLKVRARCKMIRLVCLAIIVLYSLLTLLALAFSIASYIGADNGEAAYTLVVYTIAHSALVVSMLVLFAGVFGDVVSRNEIFSAKQADRLRAIALLAIAVVAIDALQGVGATFQVFPAVGGLVDVNGVQSKNITDVDVGMLVFSAIMYSLSAIFRYAALLQQLSDDTV